MLASVYDGLDERALAKRLGLPRVVIRDEVASTMDIAHSLAADGVEGGTLVIAHAQTSGRGRSGAPWLGTSTSILCTLLEREPHATALDCLSLRVGLRVARALDGFLSTPAGLKWPNDIIVNGGKAGGILIEARWRDQHPEWVAVAIGLNVGPAPDGLPTARGLGLIRRRLDVLDVIVGAMRKAVERSGPLDAQECSEWEARDRLLGRRATQPVRGVIRGILPTGELRVDGASGVVAVRSGSIVLEDEL